ncbi:MAG: hypothetical protein JNK70_11210 [Phycisphaerae bacterium]|nr:hypothetical protein [Phycisphaerae bacterium]
MLDTIVRGEASGSAPRAAAELRPSGESPASRTFTPEPLPAREQPREPEGQVMTHEPPASPLPAAGPRVAPDDSASALESNPSVGGVPDHPDNSNHPDHPVSWADEFGQGEPELMDGDAGLDQFVNGDEVEPSDGGLAVEATTLGTASGTIAAWSWLYSGFREIFIPVPSEMLAGFPRPPASASTGVPGGVTSAESDDE